MTVISPWSTIKYKHVGVEKQLEYYITCRIVIYTAVCKQITKQGKTTTS